MIKYVVATLLIGLFVLSCTNKSERGFLDPALAKKVSDEALTDVYDPRVDVLFVVDNSGSMGSHQANVASNINLFLADFLANNTLDYQMGVISTDVSERGQLQGFPAYITKGTINGASMLARNIVGVGTSGDAEEKVFDPTILALSPPTSSGANSGFLRPGAYLAVIFITDAEDQSTMNSVQTFYDSLLLIKNGEAHKVLAYGAIIPSNSTIPNCDRDSGDTPQRIEGFLSMTVTSPDNIMEICAPDFGASLARLGSSLVKNIVTKIVLKRAPIVETIVVTFGTQIIEKNYSTGWSFDSYRNAIILGKNIVWTPQPAGTTLKVDYRPARF